MELLGITMNYYEVVGITGILWIPKNYYELLGMIRIYKDATMVFDLIHSLRSARRPAIAKSLSGRAWTRLRSA